MWHINDLYGVNAAYPAELLSVIALDNLDPVEARAKRLLDANRPVLNAFLQSRRGSGMCSCRSSAPSPFPSWKGSVDELDRLLREKYETSRCSRQLLRHAATFSRRHRRRPGDDAHRLLSGWARRWMNCG